MERFAKWLVSETAEIYFGLIGKLAVLCLGIGAWHLNRTAQSLGWSIFFVTIGALLIAIGAAAVVHTRVPEPRSAWRVVKTAFGLELKLFPRGPRS